MSKQTIPASDEAWENRLLGADDSFVKAVTTEVADQIDDAAGSQLISIRMQKSTIEDLKVIASFNKLGYQTLMKQVIQRFVDCEKKQMWRDLVSEKLSEHTSPRITETKQEQVKQPRKKAA